MYDFIDTTKVPPIGQGVLVTHGVRLSYATRYASVPALTDSLEELTDALWMARDEETDPADRDRLQGRCVQFIRLRNAVRDAGSLRLAAPLIRQAAQTLQHWTDLPAVERAHGLLLGILPGLPDA